MWKWPLRAYPLFGKNLFGSVNDGKVETGIRICCVYGAKVQAVEDSFVTMIYDDGEMEEPYIIAEGKSGAIAYVCVDPIIALGQDIRATQVIGHVRDKFYIEQYGFDTYVRASWNKNCKRPLNLLDPTKELMNAAMSFSDHVFVWHESCGPMLNIFKCDTCEKMLYLDSEFNPIQVINNETR